MAQAAAQRSTAKSAGPSASTLLARVRELDPLFREQASANEAEGKLTARVEAAIADAGLFGMWIPHCYGGSEVSPVEGLQIIEALSYADGSTGWVVMATQVAAGTAAAYLDASAADAIFGERIPVFAGVGAPRGRADPENGGYRLNGDWSYGSGIKHAEWLHTGVMIFENGAPRTIPGSKALDARIFVIKVADTELLGNWDVLGLRATGSVDYAVKDLYVPEEYTHIQTLKQAKQGGTLYKLGIQGLGGICHSGFALGTARRALDELAALARAETGRPQLLPERGGGESFQEKFAYAEAKFRAARALVVESLVDVERSLEKGDDVSTHQFTMMRLALNHVTSVAGEVCEFTFKYGGGIALRDGALQRCFRDMCTGMQHITTGPNILRQCGIGLLGLAEGKVWGPRTLIDPP